MSKEVGEMVQSRKVAAAAAPTEGARRATGVGAEGAAAGTGGLAPGQRWSASRKRDVVLRRGVVARIVTGPHDAHRQDPHLPIRYDTGRPSSVIRLRISQPRTTSLPCPVGLRARRPSPMMDLYRKNVFSTRL